MNPYIFKFFWCFNADIFNGRHQCGDDSFRLLLTNSEPLRTYTSKSSIVEIAGGAGYPAGGIPISVVSSSQIQGLYKWIIQDVLLAATGTMAPWRYSVIYNSTSSGFPVIGYMDYGQIYSLVASEEFSFKFDQVNGLINAPTNT